MQRRGLLAGLLLLWVALPARGSILLFLDDVDNYRFVNEVVKTEPVAAEARELKALADELLKLKRPEIVKLLGEPGIKPPQAYAMPLGEQRVIGFSGLRSVDDKRPDEHFIQFHPLGDYAAVEVYYGRDETGNSPFAVRFYLRADEKFVKLNKDNVDQRLMWEWERIAKLKEKMKAGMTKSQ